MFFIYTNIPVKRERKKFRPRSSNLCKYHGSPFININISPPNKKEIGFSNVNEIKNIMNLYHIHFTILLSVNKIVEDINHSMWLPREIWKNITNMIITHPKNKIMVEDKSFIFPLQLTPYKLLCQDKINEEHKVNIQNKKNIENKMKKKMQRNLEKSVQKNLQITSKIMFRKYYPKK